MTANEYRKVMIDILELQKNYYDPEEDDKVRMGLDIAIEKLRLSEFLTEGGEE